VLLELNGRDLEVALGIVLLAPDGAVAPPRLEAAAGATRIGASSWCCRAPSWCSASTGAWKRCSVCAEPRILVDKAGTPGPIFDPFGNTNNSEAAYLAFLT
jgi:hypothetical protein